VFLALHGKHAASYPSKYPLFRLDRIYARGLVPSSGEVLISAPWCNLSDHAPLRATFSSIAIPPGRS
jgi:endonuclease/exonuclease/phosphatase family metal-dependent hydrolase